MEKAIHEAALQRLPAQKRRKTAFPRETSGVTGCMAAGKSEGSGGVPAATA